ncbi:hypothetical protein [Isoptericola sp. BMS4]|uniref:hypothetical protein n=1 Tax=Isoptericola sp. BMS4 TaxID=2527875 RepID=UPI0014201598|nr:hypothetical protein [Isoptericola sp. BMS4]
MISRRTPQPTRIRRSLVLASAGAIGTAGLLAACSPEPESAESLGARTAEAIRESGTARFEFESDDGQRFEGAIEYEDGAVAALELATYAEDSEEPTSREVWTDDAGMAADPDGGPPSAEELPDLVRAWDWAQVQEDLADAATSVEEVGERDVDGVAVTGYELTSSERTETWWVDDEGRLRSVEYSDADGSTAQGRLYDYGADVDITAP